MPVCNIFQLQRFSVNDGEGIRTTVFFKGCRLRCQWCANPESWSFARQLLFFADKCTDCGKCSEVCRQGANQSTGQRMTLDRTRCAACGVCADNCPNGARKLAGEELTVDEAVAAVKKDYLYFLESNGGVTFSGGEPFLHPEYLRELNGRCQSLGINTAAESCGFFDFDSCADIVSKLDMIFFDIKTMDSAVHKQVTGVAKEKILRNIVAAAKLNKNIVVRVPVISGINDSTDNLRKTAQFLRANTDIDRMELLKYHNLGLGKMQALGQKAYEFTAPSEERPELLKEAVAAEGIKVVSYA